MLENPHGNDLEQVIAIFKQAQTHLGKGKPIVILMKTEMGMGVDYMMGTHKWHGWRLTMNNLKKHSISFP